MREYIGNLPINKKSLAIRFAITYALIIAVIIFMYLRLDYQIEDIEGPLGYIKYIPFVLPILALFGIQYWAYRRLKRLKLVIQLHEDAINGKVEGHYDITIQNNEIESIKQKDNGDIVLKGTQKFTGLMIPRAFDGFEEIQHQLSEWQPIEQESLVGKTKIDWKSSIFHNSVGLLSSIAFAVTQFSMNYYVIIIGATVCVICSTLAYFQSKKLENTITYFKNFKWVWVFFSLIAFGKAVMIIFNPQLFT